jgi:hypothetical protein
MTPKECMPFVKAAVVPLQQSNKNQMRVILFLGTALASIAGFKWSGFNPF